MRYLKEFIDSSESSFIKKIGKIEELSTKNKEEALQRREEMINTMPILTSYSIMKEFRHWEKFKYEEIKLYFKGYFLFEKTVMRGYTNWNFGEGLPSIGFFHLLTAYEEFQSKKEQKEIKYFIWKNLHNHLSPFGRYHSYKALDADSFDAMEEDWNSILQRCKDNIERMANRYS
tara:strand:+ start:93 stop:614 length:522 start_codon:yes stop_codon:yes gene_type:complete